MSNNTVNKPPRVELITTPLNHLLIRFSSIDDLFWYDDVSNNPFGAGTNNYNEQKTYKNTCKRRTFQK